MGCENMTTKRIEVMIGLILIAFSVLVLSMALQFPEGQQHDVGARFFPTFYAYLLIFLSLLLIFNNLKDIKEKGNEQVKAEWKKAVIGMICTVLFFLLMVFAGFLIATPIFLAGMMWIYDYRRPFRVILFTVLLTTFIYVVFSILLKVSLPSGILFY